MTASGRLIISNRLLAQTVVAADSVLPALFRHTISLRMGEHYLGRLSADFTTVCIDILNTCDISHHFRTTSIASYAFISASQTCDKIHCNILQRGAAGRPEPVLVRGAFIR